MKRQLALYSIAMLLIATSCKKETAFSDTVIANQDGQAVALLQSLGYNVSKMDTVKSISLSSPMAATAMKVKTMDEARAFIANINRMRTMHPTVMRFSKSIVKPYSSTFRDGDTGTDSSAEPIEAYYVPNDNGGGNTGYQAPYQYDYGAYDYNRGGAVNIKEGYGPFTSFNLHFTWQQADNGKISSTGYDGFYSGFTYGINWHTTGWYAEADNLGVIHYTVQGYDVYSFFIAEIGTYLTAPATIKGTYNTNDGSGSYGKYEAPNGPSN